MSFILKNERLLLEIATPGIDYTRTRFDRNGMVFKITLENAYQFAGHHPVNCISGPVNEFGLHTPIGYKECLPGDWFSKIGVGLLKKIDSVPYDKFNDYQVRPYQTEIIEEPHAIHFRSDSGYWKGWSFAYEKSVLLLDNHIIFQYKLENHGAKVINTEEYNHNFFCLNGAKPEKGFSLDLHFPFSTVNEESETANYNGKLSKSRWRNFLIQSYNGLRYSCPASESFMFRNITESREVNPSWTLRDLQSGLSVTEKVDFHTSFINLWGNPDFICPELFYSINLKPGEKCHWAREYIFSRV